MQPTVSEMAGSRPVTSKTCSCRQCCIRRPYWTSKISLSRLALSGIPPASCNGECRVVAPKISNIGQQQSAMQLLLQCVILVAMLLSRSAPIDDQRWPGCLASWEEAQHQLEANEHAWSPPGTFAAALSAFKATLQDATQSTSRLKKVTVSSGF